MKIIIKVKMAILLNKISKLGKSWDGQYLLPGVTLRLSKVSSLIELTPKCFLLYISSANHLFLSILNWILFPSNIMKMLCLLCYLHRISQHMLFHLTLGFQGQNLVLLNCHFNFFEFPIFCPSMDSSIVKNWKNCMSM